MKLCNCKYMISLMKKKDDSETREQNQDHRWSIQDKQDNSETWKPKLRLLAGIYQTGFRNCFEIVTPFHLSLSAFLGKNVYTIILCPIIVCLE